jgi:hypothetical protein
MKKVVSVMLAVAACSTTAVIATWRPPSGRPLDFKRVLVIAPVTDPALRRSIEDQGVAALPPGAVASYRVAPQGVSEQAGALDDAAQHQGFDAAVVLRVAAVSRERNWVPGAAVFGAWTPFDPRDVTAGADVRVEASVYLLPVERAVFSAASFTAPVENLRGLIADTLGAVRDEVNRPVHPVS